MILEKETRIICSRILTRTLVLCVLALAGISFYIGESIANGESDFDGISRGTTPFVQVFRDAPIKIDKMGNAYMVLKLHNNTEISQCARAIDVRGTHFEDNAIVKVNGTILPYKKFNDWAERNNNNNVFIFRPKEILQIPVNIKDYYNFIDHYRHIIEIRYFIEFVKCNSENMLDVKDIRSSWSYKEAFLGGQYTFFKYISFILKPIWFFQDGTVLEMVYTYDPNKNP